MTNKYWIGTLIALVLVLCFGPFNLTNHFRYEECIVLIIASVCAILWVTEWLPIPITSLIPFVFFPLFGILEGKIVAQSYGHSMILLLMGGFILSIALEHSGVHKRSCIGDIVPVGYQAQEAYRYFC